MTLLRLCLQGAVAPVPSLLPGSTPGTSPPCTRPPSPEEATESHVHREASGVQALRPARPCPEPGPQDPE